MMANSSSKDAAQRRADQIRAFRAELETLQAEGVTPLDRKTMAAVRTHHDELLQRLTREYDVDATVAARRMSRGMQVASLLGAAALVAAIVSFFYRVWGTLGGAAHVALLTAAPMTAVVAMIVSARLEATRYLASICAIVASAAVVLQTTMLGQMFNLAPSPHALGLWAAFALGISWPWRFGVPFAWGAGALVCYLAALALMAAGGHWRSFPERPETLMIGAALVLAASGRVPFELRPWGRAIGLLFLLVPMLVMSSVDMPSLLPVAVATSRVTYQVFCVAAAVAVIAIGLRHGYGETVTIGALFAAAFLLARFVSWWWDLMPKYLFFLILAGVAVGWLWVLRAARRRLVEQRG
jgi:hypothetical protein